MKISIRTEGQEAAPSPDIYNTNLITRSLRLRGIDAPSIGSGPIIALSYMRIKYWDDLYPVLRLIDYVEERIDINSGWIVSWRYLYKGMLKDLKTLLKGGNYWAAHILMHRRRDVLMLSWAYHIAYSLHVHPQDVALYPSTVKALHYLQKKGIIEGLELPVVKEQRLITPYWQYNPRIHNVLTQV